MLPANHPSNVKLPTVPGRLLTAVGPKRKAAFDYARSKQLAEPNLHPLRRARLEHGLTVENLAAAAGCSESLIFKVERGRLPLTAAAAERFADVLWCAPELIRP